MLWIIRRVFHCFGLEHEEILGAVFDLAHVLFLRTSIDRRAIQVEITGIYSSLCRFDSIVPRHFIVVDGFLWRSAVDMCSVKVLSIKTWK